MTYYVKPCPKCSTNNHPNLTYCGKCGADLPAEKQASDTPPTDPPAYATNAVQPATKKPSDWNLNQDDGITECRIVDIQMPFWSMVVFMVKAALAAIPAFLILTVLAMFAIALIAAMGYSTDARAAVYKCQQAGKTVYSDKPCPQAKTINTTNAKPPALADHYSARARQLRAEATISAAEAAEARADKERAQCAEIIRRHNSTMSDVVKYQDDGWWRERGLESEANVQRRCGKYMIPMGASNR